MRTQRPHLRLHFANHMRRALLELALRILKEREPLHANGPARRRHGRHSRRRVCRVGVGSRDDGTSFIILLVLLLRWCRRRLSPVLHHLQSPRRRRRACELRDGLSAHEHATQRDRVDKGAHHPLVNLARQRLRTPGLLGAQRGVAVQPEGRGDGAGVQTPQRARRGRPADLGLEALEHPPDGAGAGAPEGLTPVVGAVLEPQGVQERGAVHRRLILLQGKLPAGVYSMRRHMHVACAY
ncbi:uncharacterized protein PG998_010847 [Apiospora kogelbergensis]|uniref:uncharacterized protein n=1 Tax=Apiospora kogelbergensis TaxID=1337665 RepID=UPI003130DE76